mmetsp:Transcript_5470/g.10698  ORF Transcript_5470/g.10698 Transcript_5470/m.10698 type:complete len:110 (-) Transcript_5470:367-696(-)
MLVPCVISTIYKLATIQFSYEVRYLDEQLSSPTQSNPILVRNSYNKARDHTYQLFYQLPKKPGTASGVIWLSQHARPEETNQHSKTKAYKTRYHDSNRFFMNFIKKEDH